MICMCHGKEGRGRIYNGGVLEREWTREWIGERKEICSLGAADGHMMATWLMGVIVRVE
jgi:hypothetical protein